MPKRKAASEDEVSEQEEKEDEDDETTSGSEEEAISKSKSKGKKKEVEKKMTIKKPKINSKSSPSKSTGTTKTLTNAEGDKYIDLGKKKRAVIRSFKGMPLLDIREYYGAEGEEKPGKKGIALQLEQWHTLRDNISTIDDLFSKLKK